jgi:uncharacterized protein
MNLLYEFWRTYMELAPYLLLGLAMAGLLHVVFPKRLILKHMGGSNLSSAVKAAALGVPMPLCSCGVIPTALHLRRNGASKGATLSFLISTPQTGIESIVPTYGMLGPVFAIYRPLVALVMGVVGGVIANRTMPGDPPPEAIDTGFHCDACDNPVPHTHTVTDRIRIGALYAFRDFFDDISVQLLFGLLFAAMISWLIPDGFFETFGGRGLLGMVLMMLIGIPLYVCATASIPIAVSLMLKGISPGAAFVFLVTGPATNAATITVIGKALGKRFVSIYLLVIGVLSITFGLLLNRIFSWLGINPLDNLIYNHHVMNDMSVMSWVWIGLFSILFLMSLTRKLLPRMGIRKGKVKMNTFITYRVEGMTCNHCVRHVENALRELPGVTSVEVSLGEKTARIKGDVDPVLVIETIDKAGYKAAKE